MPLRFFGINVADRNQYPGLLDIPEIGVDDRSENAHRRRKAHVRVDQRRDVFTVIADLADQRFVVFRIAAAAEQRFHLFDVEIEGDRVNGLDQVFAIREMFAQEIEQDVAGFFVVRAVLDI